MSSKFKYTMLVASPTLMLFGWFVGNMITGYNPHTPTAIVIAVFSQLLNGLILVLPKE